MKLCQLPSKVIDPVDLNTRPSAGTVYQPKQRNATVHVRLKLAHLTYIVASQKHKLPNNYVAKN